MIKIGTIIINYINKNDDINDDKFKSNTNDKIMWKTVKNFTNSSKQTPPRVSSFNSFIN